MSKITTVSNWLVDAKQLKPGDQLDIYLSDHKGPPPTYPDMRDALYAQFGQDTPIRIWKHGQRICVFIHHDAESRERFDRQNTPIVIKDDGKSIEIVSGFEKELPETVTK